MSDSHGLFPTVDDAIAAIALEEEDGCHVTVHASDCRIDEYLDGCTCTPEMLHIDRRAVA